MFSLGELVVVSCMQMSIKKTIGAKIQLFISVQVIQPIIQPVIRKLKHVRYTAQSSQNYWSTERIYVRQDHGIVYPSLLSLVLLLLLIVQPMCAALSVSNSFFAGTVQHEQLYRPHVGGV